MKKYILVLLAGTALFSCKPDGAKDFFTIDATIDTIANGRLAKLVTLKDRKPVTKDSILIADGKINFQGKVESPDLYFITIDGYRSNLAMVLENEIYEVNLNADSLHTSKVNGGKENGLFIEYQEFVKEIGKTNQKFGMEYRQAQMTNDTITMELVRKKYDSLMEVNKNYDIDFITRYKADAASALLLEQLCLSRRIENEKAIELYNSLSDYSKNTRAGKAVAELLKIGGEDEATPTESETKENSSN